MTDIRRKPRYAYIDNMKFAACVLVAAGHFFMSLTANGLMPASKAYYYILQTVYTFHVPVFFVCSGFLYQTSNRVHGVKAWRQSVLRKLLDLGVPYVLFTTVTVLLKHLFEDSVTSKAGDLVSTLFLYPTAPYWYLYVLFFLFLMVPCMKSKQRAGILLLISLLLKLGIIALNHAGINPEQWMLQHAGRIAYVAVHIFLYAAKRLIWFAIGIYLAFMEEEKIKKYGKLAAPLLLMAAAAVSAFTFQTTGYTAIWQLVVGILFVCFITVAAITFTPRRLSSIALRCSELFMPVFVLHTIYSAGIRIALLKIGVTSLPLHLLGGVLGSFILPVVTYSICQKLTPLLFVFYPTKTIKLMRHKYGKSKEAA